MAERGGQSPAVAANPPAATAADTAAADQHADAASTSTSAADVAAAPDRTDSSSSAVSLQPCAQCGEPVESSDDAVAAHAVSGAHLAAVVAALQQRVADSDSAAAELQQTCAVREAQLNTEREAREQQAAQWAAEAEERRRRDEQRAAEAAAVEEERRTQAAALQAQLAEAQQQAQAARDAQQQAQRAADEARRQLQIQQQQAAEAAAAATAAAATAAAAQRPEAATPTAATAGTSSSSTSAAPSECSTPQPGGDAFFPAASPLTSSELSELSLKFFPEIEPLLGSVPPVPTAHVYTAASVYLYDSFHCRSIKHSTTLAALRAYKFIHVSRWKLFVRWVGWMHLLLGFVEPPSSITVNGERYGPSHLAAACIEAVCLAIYSFHAFRQYKAYGPGRHGFWRSQWRTTKVFVLAACWIDVIISGARNVDGPGVHLSQLLRVFFVLEQSGRMRQLCSCILKSLPNILSIMFLCFVHIVTFGFLGFLFIGPLEVRDGEHGKVFYDTLGNSLLSTCIMLTSENFPELMLPSYRTHWFVCLYFVAFLIIGLYGLQQLTTAVVFHSFQMHTKEKVQRALSHRERAMQAAFTLVSEYECGDGVIHLEGWQRLMKALRPDWSEQQAEILFRAAAGPAEAAAAAAQEEHPKPASIDYFQFEQIVRFTQKSFQFVTASPAVEDSSVVLSPAAAAAATAALDADVSISMASVQTTLGAPASDRSATALHSNPLLVGLTDSSGAGSRGGGGGTWGGVAPLYVQLHPLIARFARLLRWYFTFRLPIPKWVLVHVLGRTEAHLRELEESEGPVDVSVAGPTPIHPLLRTRTRVTTVLLCEVVSDLLTVAHTLLLVLLMALESEELLPASAGDALAVGVLMLQVQFALEMLAKAWLCRTRFFNSHMHRFDLAALVLVWASQIVMLSYRFGTEHMAVSSVRLVRVLRLSHRLGSFTLLLRVLSQVGPALAALLGVLFILLYSYSVVGMMWFCNELLPGKLDPALDYVVSNFLPLHFNDLAHSFISLFYQLVVNDWWLLMEACASRVGPASRVFFISFYAISVLIVFSVCTAFVVEAYMDMHERRVANSLRGKTTSNTQLESLSLPVITSLAPGLAEQAAMQLHEAHAQAQAQSGAERNNNNSSGNNAAAGGAAGAAGGYSRPALRSNARRPSTQIPSMAPPMPLAIGGSGGGSGGGGGGGGGSGNGSRATTPAMSIAPPSPSTPGTPHRGSFGARGVLQTAGSFRQFHQAVHMKSVAPLQRGQSMRGNSFTKVRGAYLTEPLSAGVQSSAAISMVGTPPPISWGSGAGGSGGGSTSSLLDYSSVAPSPTHISAGSVPTSSHLQSVTDESALLSRIRDHAGSMGLRVKVKPAGGLFNTLAGMFGSELEEEAQDGDDHEEDDEDEEDGTGEEHE